MPQTCTPSNDDDIHELLVRNWDALAHRAAHRAAGRIVWNRRLRKLNLVLATATVLMALQALWSVVLLAGLQGAAAQMAETARAVLWVS